MHTTYGMDTCIETNEILAFGMEVYSRYIAGICKNLEYVRHIPDVCLTYDTIRIPDECKLKHVSINRCRPCRQFGYLPCAYWRGASAAPVFRGARQIPPAGFSGGVAGRGVGVVRGYGHGTTGGSGTEAVWVTNLQDKCLIAGCPPAPDLLRMLS